jgi:hypothetical protein
MQEDWGYRREKERGMVRQKSRSPGIKMEGERWWGGGEDRRFHSQGIKVMEPEGRSRIGLVLAIYV